MAGVGVEHSGGNSFAYRPRRRCLVVFDFEYLLSPEELEDVLDVSESSDSAAVWVGLGDGVSEEGGVDCCTTTSTAAVPGVDADIMLSLGSEGGALREREIEEEVLRGISGSAAVAALELLENSGRSIGAEERDTCMAIMVKTSEDGWLGNE